MRIPHGLRAALAGQVSGGDPYFNSVSLLMYGDGTNGSTTFVDSSSNNFTITPYGNAQISTTQSKFGGASMYFDGNGDYATIPVDADFEFGTGDFTIEFWIRLDSIPSLVPVVCLGIGAGGAGIYSAWSITIVSEAFWFYRYDGAETYYTFNANLSTSTWYHVAFARSGTSLRCFVDGTQVGTTQSTSLSYNKVNNDPLQIGFFRSGSGGSVYNYLPGYIDDLRITKGVARYTANFTPPTAAFPDA